MNKMQFTLCGENDIIRQALDKGSECMQVIQKLKAKAENISDCPSVTIAFLGDSVTQGCFDVYVKENGGIETYFDAEHAYHTQVRKILNMLYPAAPVNIINAGISGGNARQGCQRLERDVLRYSPDLCVVCFGLNDSCNLPIEEYKQHMSEIFDRLQAAGIEVILMTPNMMCTKVSCHIEKPFVREIAANISRAQTEGTLKQFLTAAKEIATAKQIPICDCYSKWELLYNGGVDTTELLSNKINHPTAEMNWMFAYSLVETMFDC